MQEDYTHITAVLDRSGSMATINKATVDGFNTFLESQKKEKGKATLTLIGFDDRYEVWRDFLPIQQVDPLVDLGPRGWTALHDAMGKAITETGAALESLPISERPAKVLVLIMTDGMENASKEFNADSVSKLVSHQKEKYLWEFTYIGANQDAILTAKSLGIGPQAAMNYAANSQATANTFKNLTRGTSTLRAASANMRGKSLQYFEEERRSSMVPDK